MPASICSSCGGPLGETGTHCPKCGSSTTRRHPVFSREPSKTPAPALDLTLPCLVPEARFTVGEAWTQGQLYLVELGLYFLAAKDGPWTPERLATIMPPDPGSPHRVADASFFVPLNRIQRFQHSRLTSFAMHTTDGKKPLRLNPEGWRMIDAFGAKVGIPTT